MAMALIAGRYDTSVGRQSDSQTIDTVRGNLSIIRDRSHWCDLFRSSRRISLPVNTSPLESLEA